MKLHCIFIACLALFALCTLARSEFVQGPEKCCFSFSNMRIPLKQIESYHTTSPGCHRSGIIIITKNGTEICADPNERWVQRMQKLVNTRTMKETSESR